MEKGSQKRWYDHDTHVATAVDLVMKFPPEIQSIIFKGIYMLAEKEFRANELMNEFKTLGTEKVLAMYKSKEKKRIYDQDPNTHKAMNYLYLLSEQNRKLMAHHILSLMGVMQDYLKVCQNAKQAPKSGEVASLTDSYVDSGIQAAKSMLAELENIYLSTAASPKPTPEIPERGQRVADGGADLKITGSTLEPGNNEM